MARIGRILMVLALVVAVASLFGFANSFAVNSNEGQEGQVDISSGADEVDSCSGNVEVDITNGAYVQAAEQDFTVGKVKVNADPTCKGDIVYVQLTKDMKTGAPIGTTQQSNLDHQGDAELDFSAQKIPVKKVQDVHVAIEADNPWPGNQDDD